MTKSEHLFFEYCRVRGYVVNRNSAPADGGRFADYEVLIGKNCMIAEIIPDAHDAVGRKVMRPDLRRKGYP